MDKIDAQIQTRASAILAKLKQSWPQFVNIGNRKRLGSLLRENPIIRFGSILHKLFFDQDAISLYKHLSLEYLRLVIRHKFIPKVYEPNYHHDFETYLKYLRNKKTIVERKRKFQTYRSELELDISRLDRQKDRKEILKLKTQLSQ